MPRMQIVTDETCFQNDLGDVIRLFFGEGAADEDGRDILTHTHREENGLWTDTVRLELEGQSQLYTLSAPAVSGTPVEVRRYAKRLAKRTAYQALKQATGRELPWGSLTGIRPSRLFRQQMETGLTAEETERLFRDEFDVSPDRIALVREVLDTQQGMTNGNPDEMDLYVGIPFCTTRCSYCSFSSGVIGDGHLVEPYLAALLSEIGACAALVQEHHLSIRTAYIGGGTPTSLSAAQLKRLLQFMHESFPDLSEWTVEAGRPDTIDRAKLSVMRQFPITRISINPQSMNDVTLAAIGRAHSAADCLRAFEEARAAGFEDINMDIITALPGEDLPMFRHTLEVIDRLRPDSLTVHTLAIKHASKLHEIRYEQRTDEMITQMADEGRALAHRLGMRAYYLYRQKYMASNLENVGYARPGKICRYNIDNMEETKGVLALGAGAISKRLMGHDQRILRAPNVSNIETYISRVNEMVQRKADMLKAKPEGEESHDTLG